LQVDLQTNLTNCGVCNKQCAVSVLNAEGVTCSAGVCDYTQCSAGYDDCNKVRSDGCEVRSTAAPDYQQQQQRQQQQPGMIAQEVEHG
jgi:hypothetical protein